MHELIRSMDYREWLYDITTVHVHQVIIGRRPMFHCLKVKVPYILTYRRLTQFNEFRLKWCVVNHGQFSIFPTIKYKQLYIECLKTQVHYD